MCDILNKVIYFQDENTNEKKSICDYIFEKINSDISLK